MLVDHLKLKNKSFDLVTDFISFHKKHVTIFVFYLLQNR